MSQDEVLRMIAKLRDDVSSPLSRIEKSLKGTAKRGQEASKGLKQGFKGVHEQLRKVGDVARTGAAPAIDAIGISSLSAVGAVAALTAGLKSFADQGADVAAFGRRVMLTTDTIRGLEGAAEKFHVDPSAIRAGEEAFTQAMYQIRRRRGDVYAHLLAQRSDFAAELSSTPETTEGNEKALKSFLKVLEDVKKVHGEQTARQFSKEVFGTDAFVDLLRKGNAGLEEAIKLTQKLRGIIDTDAGEKWNENWSRFKDTIEGVRNAVGNDLLPDLTELARQGREFFSEHKAEIGHNIADTVREIGTALRGVNTGVQAIGGWKVVFEGLMALKLLGLAGDVLKVFSALRLLATLGTPPGWVLALLGVSAAVAVESKTPESQKRMSDSRKILADNPWIADPDGAFASSMNSMPKLTRHRPRFVGRGEPDVSGQAASVIQGLRDRGLDAPHAAILSGNIKQESEFDPTKPNVAEGGIGLIQWRKERRDALRAFAAKRHTLETDLATQLDFMKKELDETPEGRAFLSAQSPEAMNGALHRHIRYGDNSEGTRLAYGRSLLPLSEKTQPGSLLAAAGKSGAMGGGNSTVTGSASLTVDVRAPRGTSVKADADGLFNSVEVNRGLAMKPADE